MTDIEDFSDVSESLSDLLAAAEAADIPREALVGLLTARLAAMRGTVRLPLSMPPTRAREFTDRARDHVGETMQVELLVSEDVVDDLELQLDAFERPGSSGSTTDRTDE